MKKPFLLFALKAAVILYFAACTSIDNYKTGKAATPIVTKGAWKVDLLKDANNDRTNDLAGYSFTFNSSGIITASKNGVDVNGNWFEDDISNLLTLDLGASDPSLRKINGQWNIKDLSNATIKFENESKTNDQLLNITIL